MKAPTIVEIGRNTYRICSFDPFRQLRLFGDLQKEILPAVGGVLNVAMAKTENGDAQDRAAIEAFRDLSSRFDGKTLERWAGLLLDGEFISVEIEGEREPRKLDKHAIEDAMSDFADVLELMFHVGKVNFAAPLARWASLSGLAQKLTARLSASSAKTSSASS